MPIDRRVLICGLLTGVAGTGTGTGAGAGAGTAPATVNGGGFTPQMYGAAGNGIADDTDAIKRALAAASEVGAPLVLGAGTFLVSGPISVGSRQNVVILPGSKIAASPEFKGEAIFVIGSEAGYSEFWSITGGGDILCEGRCSNGVSVECGRFGKISDISIYGASEVAVVVGKAHARSHSYEVNISDVRLHLGDVRNSSGSIGLWINNASDCYVSRVNIVGYSIGVKIDGGSVDVSQCHVWIRPVNGVLTHGFWISGDHCSLVQCYADTPTNYADISVSDCYGFLVQGQCARLLSVRVFLNTSGYGGVLARDGVVTAVAVLGRQRYAKIWGLDAFGETEKIKFKSKIHFEYSDGSSAA